MGSGGVNTHASTPTQTNIVLAFSLGGWLANDGWYGPINQDNLKQAQLGVGTLEVGSTMSELCTEAPTMFVIFFVLFKSKRLDM